MARDKVWHYLAAVLTARAQGVAPEFCGRPDKFSLLPLRQAQAGGPVCTGGRLLGGWGHQARFQEKRGAFPSHALRRASCSQCLPDEA